MVLSNQEIVRFQGCEIKVQKWWQEIPGREQQRLQGQIYDQIEWLEQELGQKESDPVIKVFYEGEHKWEDHWNDMNLKGAGEWEQKNKVQKWLTTNVAPDKWGKSRNPVGKCSTWNKGLRRGEYKFSSWRAGERRNKRMFWKKAEGYTLLLGLPESKPQA